MSRPNAYSFGCHARLAAAVAAAALIMFGATRADAGLPANCRELSFEGAAGAASNDKVTFRALDALGAELDLSCLMQVQPDETAAHFAQRMPGEWGDGQCGVPVPTPTPPLKSANKTCGNGAPVVGTSCKHKFKSKSNGTITLRVCCWEGPNCSGLKLGKTDPSRLPISIQQKKDPAPIFGPTPVPIAVEQTQVALDPIGASQGPFRGFSDCLNALGGALSSLTSTTAQSQVLCRRGLMLGKFGSPVDCEANLDASSQAGIDAAEAALTTAAVSKCASLGLPSKLKLGPTCPAPCDSILLGTCAAGAPPSVQCANDADCDTAPGAGDGQCGSTCTAGTIGSACLANGNCNTSPTAHDGVCGGAWGPLSNCVSCLTENAIVSAMTDKYGSPSPGPGQLSDQGVKCQDGIGTALSYLISSTVSDLAICQKTINTNKGVLPPGVCETGNVGASCLFDTECDSSPGSGDGYCPRSCTTADLKGKRVLAVAKAQALIAKTCLDDTTLQEVGPCNPAATTIAQAQTCVVANAKTAVKTIGNAVFPQRQAPSCPSPSGPCPTQVQIDVDGDKVDYDRGWTGIAHDANLPSPIRLTMAVNSCAGASEPSCGQCNATGPIPNSGGLSSNNHRCELAPWMTCTSNVDCGAQGPCVFFLGPPEPISAGGVSLCMLTDLSSASGVVNVDTGAAAMLLPLRTRTATGLTVSEPCPRCVSGTCDAGPRTGAVCVTNATSSLYGDVSLDCPPNPGGIIGDVTYSLPLTTGNVSATLSPASPNCRAPGFTGMKCLCDTCDNDAQSPCSTNADCPPNPPSPGICGGKRCVGGTNHGAACTTGTECPGGQCGVPGAATQPNACSDGVCSPNAADLDSFNEGVCNGGPLETFCAIESFRGCITNAECPAPGDTCSVSRLRECYTDNGTVGGQVTAAGSTGASCGSVRTEILAGKYCIPPTTSGFINGSEGAPGLGRVTMPVKLTFN